MNIIPGKRGIKSKRLAPMDIPENLSKYITADERCAAWHNVLLSKYNIQCLSKLSCSDLAEIDANDLFKQDSDGKCVAPDRVYEFVAKFRNWAKKKRRNYTIDWKTIRRRGLLGDFSPAQLPFVESASVKVLPNFQTRFPVELVRRLSKIKEIHYENIFSRGLLYDPYLNSHRWRRESRNGPFVHNPELLNNRVSCYFHSRSRERIRFEDTALGYDFWNHLLWLAGLSPKKWRKIEKYNLLSYKTEDMIAYMRLSDDTLKKINEKSFIYWYISGTKAIWNSVRRIGGLDDVCVRRYGKVYEDVAHFPKARKLKEEYEKREAEEQIMAAYFIAHFFGDTSLLDKNNSIKALKKYGVNLPKNPSAKEIKDALWILARLYHPDKAPAGREKDYTEKFQEISAATTTLRKLISQKSGRKK